MSVIIPASDKKCTATALAVTNAATAVANSSGTALVSALQKQYQANTEHVVELMVTGKLSPLTILSTCTYGT